MNNSRLQTLSFNAPSLDNNQLKDSSEREVVVYLPPSYEHDKNRYFPVIYLMHGFGGNAKAWFSDEIPLHNIADQLIERGEITEMIIVAPENSTKQTCSAYLNSPIQGNWQDFICKDLVNIIETNYRCQQGWENRAIIGHSSGGDAVLQTLLLSPQVFKHGFAMSAPNITPSSQSKIRELYTTSFATLEQAQQGKIAIEELTVWAHIVLCCLQIAFPEANNPPLYCKFPLQDNDWNTLSEGSHSALYKTHKDNLHSVNLALDAGLKEPFINDSREFVTKMQSDGVNAQLFEFNGGHVDHIDKSLFYVLPYISHCLSTNK